MTVYRPKNSPHYHYDFQFKGVRYYGSTNCVTKPHARQFERDKRAEVALGKKDKPHITIDEATGIYWSDKGRFESASKTTEYQLANINRLYGALTILHSLDDLDVSEAIAKRRGEPAKNRAGLVSNATVNRETELFKRVIRHVASRYRVPELQWSNHHLKEQDERIREASPKEEAALFKVLDAMDEDLAALVEFALLSGARKDAIVTLLWSKVNLSQGWADVRTKGDTWHRIYLTPRMVAILANRPKVGPRVFTYVCQRTSPVRKDTIRRIKGERYPFSKQGWDRRWRKALKDAGIEDFRFHDLRHTFGTRITRSSNLKVTQKLLGHTRIETTARYAHAEEADLRSAMEKAEQSRNSPEQKTETFKNSRISANDR